MVLEFYHNFRIIIGIGMFGLSWQLPFPEKWNLGKYAAAIRYRWWLEVDIGGRF